MREVVIADYVRTPRGKATARGGLAHLTATDLVGHLMAALPGRTGLDPTSVEDVIQTMATVEAAYRSNERGGEPVVI